MMRALLLLMLVLALPLAACSGAESRSKELPDKSRDKLYKQGSLLSDEGGASLLGDSRSKGRDGADSGIGVNGYLWRAALDSVAFLPVQSADPFGGVILTDWHSEAAAPDERVKLNIFVLGRELRSDGIRVSVFRQVRNGQAWKDAEVSAQTARKLEDTILTRARALRLQSVQNAE